MRSFYRIMLPNGGGKCYTTSRACAEELKNIAFRNGYKVVIQRLTKMEIPMSDLELVADL